MVAIPSRLSCKRAGKTRTLMPVCDSSGESRLKACVLHKSVASKTVAVAPDLVMRPLVHYPRMSKPTTARRFVRTPSRGQTLSMEPAVELEIRPRTDLEPYLTPVRCQIGPSLQENAPRRNLAALKRFDRTRSRRADPTLLCAVSERAARQPNCLIAEASGFCRGDADGVTADNYRRDPVGF